MFGINVGYNYDRLKQEVEKELSKSLEGIHKKAYEASARTPDIDQKVATAVTAAIQEAIPHVIALTINENNKGLATTLDRFADQVGKAIRR